MKSLWRRRSERRVGEWAVTYVKRRNELCSFSKLSFASPMSQLILQPFPCFTYVTAHSPTLLLLHLCHSSFSNPSFASPTSQDFHLRHLASRPCHPRGPRFRAVFTHGLMWIMDWGGKFFEPVSLFCHFMIWVCTIVVQAFRILYRVNVVKFVKLIILW